MITADHPLIQLLALIDLVWIEAELGPVKRGGPKFYGEMTLFKVYMVSLLKQLWAHRSLWRYLSSMPLVASACGLVRLPDRRTPWIGGWEKLRRKPRHKSKRWA